MSTRYRRRSLGRMLIAFAVICILQGTSACGSLRHGAPPRPSSVEIGTFKLGDGREVRIPLTGEQQDPSISAQVRRLMEVDAQLAKEPRPEDKQLHELRDEAARQLASAHQLATATSAPTSPDAELQRAQAALNRAENRLDNPDYTTVPVLYGTDRERRNANPPMYGPERGSTLQYGLAQVSIPREHKMGSLEEPSWLRLEFTEDPSKHVVLLSATPQSRQEFIASLDSLAREGEKETGRREALLFVHGYNVSFEDAVRRTAQISYDLGFVGAPAAFSWPSKASYVAYPKDETEAEWAIPHFAEFIDHIVRDGRIDKLHIIAHSMGTRILCRALASISRETLKQIRTVSLAAPDIDADVFVRDIAPMFASGTALTTLYASSNDTALRASKAFHGSRRAGDATGGIVIASGVDTIDASDVDTSLIGHSYYGDRRSIIADLFQVLREGKGPRQRFGLTLRTRGNEHYWTMRP